MDRARDWDVHLRQATGVRGFIALYEVLGLPSNKLASAATIKSAYKRMSLIWHPDKHHGMAVMMCSLARLVLFKLSG